MPSRTIIVVGAAAAATTIALVTWRTCQDPETPVQDANKWESTDCCTLWASRQPGESSVAALLDYRHYMLELPDRSFALADDNGVLVETLPAEFVAAGGLLCEPCSPEVNARNWSLTFAHDKNRYVWLDANFDLVQSPHLERFQEQHVIIQAQRRPSGGYWVRATDVSNEKTQSRRGPPSAWTQPTALYSVRDDFAPTAATYIPVGNGAAIRSVVVTPNGNAWVMYGTLTANPQILAFIRHDTQELVIRQFPSDKPPLPLEGLSTLIAGDDDSLWMARVSYSEDTTRLYRLSAQEQAIDKFDIPTTNFTPYGQPCALPLSHGGLLFLHTYVDDAPAGTHMAWFQLAKIAGEQVQKIPGLTGTALRHIGVTADTRYFELTDYNACTIIRTDRDGKAVENWRPPVGFATRSPVAFGYNNGLFVLGQQWNEQGIAPPRNPDSEPTEVYQIIGDRQVRRICGLPKHRAVRDSGDGYVELARCETDGDAILVAHYRSPLDLHSSVLYQVDLRQGVISKPPRVLSSPLEALQSSTVGIDSRGGIVYHFPKWRQNSRAGYYLRLRDQSVTARPSEPRLLLPSTLKELAMGAQVATRTGNGLQLDWLILSRGDSRKGKMFIPEEIRITFNGRDMTRDMAMVPQDDQQLRMVLGSHASGELPAADQMTNWRVEVEREGEDSRPQGVLSGSLDERGFLALGDARFEVGGKYRCRLTYSDGLNRIVLTSRYRTAMSAVAWYEGPKCVSAVAGFGVGVLMLGLMVLLGSRSVILQCFPAAALAANFAVPVVFTSAHVPMLLVGYLAPWCGAVFVGRYSVGALRALAAVQPLALYANAFAFKSLIIRRRLFGKNSRVMQGKAWSDDPKGARGAYVDPWIRVKVGASARTCRASEWIDDVIRNGVSRAAEWPHILVIGPANSGKTVLLHEIFRRLLERSEVQLNAPVPLWLPRMDAVMHLREAIGVTWKGCDISDHVFRMRVENDGCCVLIDGLSERGVSPTAFENYLDSAEEPPPIVAAVRNYKQWESVCKRGDIVLVETMPMNAAQCVALLRECCAGGAALFGGWNVKPVDAKEWRRRCRAAMSLAALPYRRGYSVGVLTLATKLSSCGSVRDITDLYAMVVEQMLPAASSDAVLEMARESWWVHRERCVRVTDERKRHVSECVGTGIMSFAQREAGGGTSQTSAVFFHDLVQEYLCAKRLWDTTPQVRAQLELLVEMGRQEEMAGTFGFFAHLAADGNEAVVEPLFAAVISVAGRHLSLIEVGMAMRDATRGRLAAAVDRTEDVSGLVALARREVTLLAERVILMQRLLGAMDAAGVVEVRRLLP